MSASAFLLLQSALVTALEASLPGVPVYKNRTRAVSRDVPAAVLVRLDASRDADGPIGVSDWQTDFHVEAIARADNGADPAAAVDDVLQALWAALPTVSLSGVIDLSVAPQIEWNFDAAETPVASALVRVSVLHRTEPNTFTPKD